MLGRYPCPAEVQRPALRVAIPSGSRKVPYFRGGFPACRIIASHSSSAPPGYSMPSMALNTLAREPREGCYARRWPDMGGGRGEGGSCGVSANEYKCAHHVTWSPNKLRRSTSIFNLCLWASICKQARSTSNGMVERAHRQVKDALRAKLAGARWPEKMPWVLLGLRAIHNVPCTLYSVHVNKQSGNMQLNRLKKHKYYACADCLIYYLSICANMS
jgi:hypothetical protein